MREISIIMPVYMEAANVRDAVKSAARAVKGAGLDDYEIMIVDCLRPDGSHDGTPDIIEELAKSDSHIRVFHNQYINLGKKFWMGVDNARFGYTVMIGGDNEQAEASIKKVIERAGRKDIIISYPANMEIRPLMRRVISWTFTFLMNFISGLHLRYFNGMCVHRVDLLRQVKDRNDSFAYMAEILAKLVRAGHSYEEVPLMLQKRAGGKSAAFKRDNVISVCKTLLKLFWQYRILRQN